MLRYFLPLTTQANQERSDEGNSSRGVANDSSFGGDREDTQVTRQDTQVKGEDFDVDEITDSEDMGKRVQLLRTSDGSESLSEATQPFYLAPTALRKFLLLIKTDGYISFALKFSENIGFFAKHLMYSALIHSMFAHLS